MKKINLSKEEQDLFNEVKLLSKRANQRIIRIERFLNKKDAFSIKKLKQKLEIEPLGAWTKQGRSTVKKSMTKTEMEAIKKALENFIYKSETSTVKGIKEFRQKQINSIKKRFNLEGFEFSYEDAENMFDVFDDDWNWILDYMTPSDFEGVNMDIIEKRGSLDDYITNLERYSDGKLKVINDYTLITKIEGLYNKFIKPYI